MKTRIDILLAALLALTGCNQNQMVADYSWEKDLAYRESVDYTWTPEQVKEWLTCKVPCLSYPKIL